eukprot:1184842-Prorocentrum_minimum.AAC.2
MPLPSRSLLLRLLREYALAESFPRGPSRGGTERTETFGNIHPASVPCERYIICPPRLSDWSLTHASVSYTLRTPHAVRTVSFRRGKRAYSRVRGQSDEGSEHIP